MSNWIRKINLTIGGQGESLDASTLRVKFICYRNTVQTPNSSWFRIYNVSKSTGNNIIGAIRNEALVTLSAGYQDDFGLIFRGNATYGITGRESPTDTYVDVFVNDGGLGMSRGNVNHTFDKNTTQQQKVDYLLQQLSQFGINPGTIKGLSQTPDPQSETMYGNVFDRLREIAQSNGQKMYVDNGTFNMIPTNAEGGGTIVLNPGTGLIGMPQVTTQGIIVTALISPKYTLNNTLTIDPLNINQLAMPPTLDGITSTLGAIEQLGVADGEYVIESIEFRGDTRGEEWYCIMACHGVGHGGVNSDYLPRNFASGAAPQQGGSGG